jgi:hypothetical protein
LPIVADLGGQTLSPGVYNSATSIGITGTLTLDGGGDPNAVFVFQASTSTLTTASASQVNLINGAQACNVFWQVGSSATLGTGSSFQGTIFALQSITVDTAVTIQGRVLARNGAVTLDTDTITTPSCSVPATTTTTASSTTPSTPAGPSGAPIATVPTAAPKASSATTTTALQRAAQEAATKKAAERKEAAAKLAETTKRTGTGIRGAGPVHGSTIPQAPQSPISTVAIRVTG